MSAEMPKMPIAFEVVYEFPSPFGGVHRKLDSNRWNGSMPTTSQPVYSQDQLIAYAQEATRQAMEACGKAVRSQMSTLSMHVTSRECIAYNDAVKDCDQAIRRALSDMPAQEPQP